MAKPLKIRCPPFFLLNYESVSPSHVDQVYFNMRLLTLASQWLLTLDVIPLCISEAVKKEILTSISPKKYKDSSSKSVFLKFFCEHKNVKFHFMLEG